MDVAPLDESACNRIASAASVTPPFRWSAMPSASKAASTPGMPDLLADMESVRYARHRSECMLCRPVGLMMNGGSWNNSVPRLTGSEPPRTKPRPHSPWQSSSTSWAWRFALLRDEGSMQKASLSELSGTSKTLSFH